MKYEEIERTVDERPSFRQESITASEPISEEQAGDELFPPVEIRSDPIIEPASYPSISSQKRSTGQQLRAWFVSNTFAPSWLPKGLQHPFFGYLVALLLQAIAVLATFYLDTWLQVFTIAFAGLLEVLVIALVALSWGVGPSIVATFFGACLFDYIILPPQFGWTPSDPRDIYQLLLLILVGLAISIVASQTERARRQAQHLADSLAKEHARMEGIIETVPDIVAIYDKRGRMTQMNEIGQRSRIFDPGMKDRSLEELFSVHEALTLAGQPVKIDDLPVARALRGETVESQEIRFFNDEGSECFISISAAPLRNIYGKIDGAVSVTRDLSALHQSEREAASRAEALLTMAEALVMRGDEATFKEQSRASASKKIALRMARLTSRVLNCPRVSIFLVEHETRIFHPVAIVGLSSEEEARWWSATEQADPAMAGTQASQTLAQLQAGEIVMLDSRAGPFSAWMPHSQIALVAPMSVEQRLIGFLVLDQNTPDSASLRPSQEDLALVGAVAHLLALVFERERLLYERAEAQATELALRAANRHMEEFLGMVSHELKTPLTSIQGNTQLAIRQLKGSLQTFERIMGLYEAADQQGRRLNRLVDDLLDVSRAQAGHLELVPSLCDLRMLVHEALQEQQKMWPQRTIELDMDEEIALPLEADADRVVQVISNYLTNALKYSDPDRPVSVKVQREEHYAYLAVRDEGPGLSIENQKYIWERFYRVPDVEVRSSAHASQAGLGLGLYISKTIIEGQHGEVGVQSLPGEGSTFWFRLPLHLEGQGE